MSALAPVAIFAYRRKDGLARTLTCLQACPEYAASPVFVFSDGAATAAAARDVAAVRALIAQRRTANLTVIEAETNKGLARSIIDGVTMLTQRFGAVIVVEDDLRLSPLTLTWMNRGLTAYRDCEAVMQISAHSYRAKAFEGRARGHFLPFTTTWGWATWDRAWKHFDAEAAGWETLAADADLSDAFDLGGAFPYSRMLATQMAGGHDSWGIRWYWSVFRRGGLVLYPPQTLVANRGADTKATHGMRSLLLASLRPGAARLARTLPELPAHVAVDPQDLKAAVRAVRDRRL
jgi:hypothetical protein